MRTATMITALAGLALASVASGADSPKHCTGACQSGVNTDSLMWKEQMPLKQAVHDQKVADGTANVYERSTHSKNSRDIKCERGEAAGFPCNRVDLASVVNFDDMGCTGAQGSDIWGWTDPELGTEWVLFCCTTGTSFIDISDPNNPFVAGFLPASQFTQSIWHDVKVVNDHAYIVSEASGHGMQVFDLKRLRDIDQYNDFLAEDFTYREVGSSHNIVSHHEADMVYLVGTDTCAGGLHMVDVSEPKDPQFVGCFSEDMYTHDAQCVFYHGPDVAYQGREICFNYNEQKLTIVDVTDKSAPVLISRATYASAAYTHQGWLTPDHRHILSNDERDELAIVTGQVGAGADIPCKTFVWDVSQLLAPVVVNVFTNLVPSIDHNLYIVGNLAFLQNYGSGLRILSTVDINSDGNVFEVGHFDVYPERDSAVFEGSWSNYPFFRSGVVAISAIERGLIVVRPQRQLGHTPEGEFPDEYNFTDDNDNNSSEDPADTEGSAEASTFSAQGASAAAAACPAQMSSGAVAGVTAAATLAAVGVVAAGHKLVHARKQRAIDAQMLAQSQA